MGEVLALMFISVVLFVAGVVLLIISNDVWRKAGVFMAIVGLILFIICIIYYPHARDNYDYYRDNNSQPL